MIIFATPKVCKGKTRILYFYLSKLFFYVYFFFLIYYSIQKHSYINSTMPIIPLEDDKDDDWILEDEDDPEFQAILQGNSSKGPAQRTLEGSVAAVSTRPQNDKYETIPVPVKINTPTHHAMDFENLKTYIYPTNFEIRDYQYNIVERAFYDNLLVALPTGLGKTFIASTVMLNFLRWFPISKIIFMAPTRPLVAQQIKACCSIAGIPSSKVAILLDKTRRNRAEIWNSRQVFFTTPQVVENDLASGVVNPKSIALLVIDEAHRAKGNYSYNNVVKFINRFSDSYRILALTATPASDVEGVQQIIDNLNISKVEVRTEQSIDIVRHMKRKTVERKTCYPSSEITECIELLAEGITPVLNTAKERGLLDLTDPTRINFLQCMEISRKIVANPTIPEGLKWSNYFILQLLGMVGQCYRRLNIYGIRSFQSYFNEKFLEFKTKWNAKKSTNKLNADFYFSDPITTLMDRVEELSKTLTYGHPKIEALMEELDDFFKNHETAGSRVIIFTEFRESALEIVQCIEKANDNRKPHIFIGQSKEKEKFDVENFGKKKQKGQTKKKKDERPSTRSSSENAQMTGMSQKLQKEIIKKFKKGVFNILVATSIGEEGLDIGEVDLIICYDSTSSPIKNIQRMGRTGRKRDGKVLMLFSSNEESKFDKAMGGYEYIQQHIMKGDFIQLRPQHRMIPDEYKPEAVKQLIQIPEENIELKAEDDEDEIIRIATSYMLGGKGKKGKKANNNSTKKPAKTFFMPDNVETGFKSAATMVRKVGDNKSLAERNKEKTFLDKLVDSDSDSEVDKENENVIQEVDKSKNQEQNDHIITELDNTEQSVAGNTKSTTNGTSYSEPENNNQVNQESVTANLDSVARMPEPEVIENSESEEEQISKITHNTPATSVDLSNGPEETSYKIDSVLIDLIDDDFTFSSDTEGDKVEVIDAVSPEVCKLPEKPATPPIRKSLGVKRKVNKTPDPESNSISIPSSTTKKSHNEVTRKVVQDPSTTNKKSLGVKRPRPVSIIDQLKRQKIRSQVIVSRETQSIIEHESRTQSSLPSPRNMSDEISEIDVIIDLDDDDDDDNKVISHDKSQTTISKIQPIYEFSNKEDEGFLSSSQTRELYKNYYIAIDSSDDIPFYDPVQGFSKIKDTDKFTMGRTGPITHSLRTQRLFQACNAEFDSQLAAQTKDNDKQVYTFILKK
ncbi:ATP-dependent DNA helicase MPH1 [Candida albicans P60002]|nr:ATP-dependent DNA helicase MPH1 [Candida albicans P60002]